MLLWPKMIKSTIGPSLPLYNHKGPYKKKIRKLRLEEGDLPIAVEVREMQPEDQEFKQLLETERNKEHVLPWSLQKGPSLMTSAF